VSSWLRLMKPMEKSHLFCWKAQRVSSWGIATTGFPIGHAFLRTKGIVLQAPFRLAHSPKAAAYQSPVLGRVRSLIDTVFGQLTDRCLMKRVWARDLWHLRNRVLRCILMHTVCFFFNQQDQAPYLQFDRLVT